MKTIGINLYLIVAALLFVIGVLGVVLNRRNLIAIFMAIEILLLSVTLNFVAFSVTLKDMSGQVFSLFILTVAAAEAAIALAILVKYFRYRHRLSADNETYSGQTGQFEKTGQTSQIESDDNLEIEHLHDIAAESPELIRI
jgi:NADH-quinone oxidoreductase subunit K